MPAPADSVAAARAMPADDQHERARLKSLLGRAAVLGARARALTEHTRRHDRQSAVYLANLARQAARLLQQVPASQIPLLRLPSGAGDSRGLSQHVLRHTRVESTGGVAMRLLVLSGDGRMRICIADSASPGTRVWLEYDPSQPPADFDFDETADALASLLDTLEIALAEAEARLAERVARLEQRRRDRSAAQQRNERLTRVPAAPIAPAALPSIAPVAP
ncbi:MAG: hypothetical protein MUF00_04695, partial [Gemmatimonadaceae bacterium]|nr:hypothetical protein [Gemmatimonadaceae bacterium]